MSDGQGFILAVFGAPVSDRLEGRNAVGELSATLDAHFAVGVNGRNTQVEGVLTYVNAHTVAQKGGWGLLLFFHR